MAQTQRNLLDATRHVIGAAILSVSSDGEERTATIITKVLNDCLLLLDTDQLIADLPKVPPKHIIYLLFKVHCSLLCNSIHNGLSLLSNTFLNAECSHWASTMLVLDTYTEQECKDK